MLGRRPKSRDPRESLPGAARRRQARPDRSIHPSRLGPTSRAPSRGAALGAILSRRVARLAIPAAIHDKVLPTGPVGLQGASAAHSAAPPPASATIALHMENQARLYRRPQRTRQGLLCPVQLARPAVSCCQGPQGSTPSTAEVGQRRVGGGPLSGPPKHLTARAPMCRVPCVPHCPLQ